MLLANRQACLCITNRYNGHFFSISTGVEGYYIYPIPLVIVFSTPANSDTYEIRALFYEEVKYSTVNALVEAYNNGNIRDHTPNLHKQSLDRLVEIAQLL